MKLIGLTGAYCAGKNHVAALLEKRGLPVLDVDKLGHQAINEEKAAIAARFGPDLVGEDGQVKRRLLGQRVFGKPAELAALEAIVHPAANRLTEEWVKTAACTGDGTETAVINAAVLHKSSVFPRLDVIILVEAPFWTRFWRARRRDGLSPLALLRRFGSQKSFKAQYLSAKADIYRVDNSGNAQKLEARLEEILSKVGII